MQHANWADASHVEELLAIDTFEGAERYFKRFFDRFSSDELKQVLGDTLDQNPDDSPTVRRAKEARLLVMNFCEYE